MSHGDEGASIPGVTAPARDSGKSGPIAPDHSVGSGATVTAT